MFLKNPALILLAGFAFLSGCSIGIKHEKTEDLQFTMHRYPTSAGKDACVHVTRRVLGITKMTAEDGSKTLLPRYQSIIKPGVPCQSDSLPFDPMIVPVALQVL